MVEIKEKCIEICVHSKLKVEERGRSAVFINDLENKLTKVKVDGCVDFEGPKADYAIERGNKTLIVELKGRDVEHGSNQISATASVWLDLHRCEQIAGLIVARQYPRASTAIQLKQQRFARKFNGPLHVVCNNREYDFDKVMSFRLG